MRSLGEFRMKKFGPKTDHVSFWDQKACNGAKGRDIPDHTHAFFLKNQNNFVRRNSI